MPIAPEAAAFTLICRPDGSLAEVIYDEVGLNSGRDLFALVHSSSLRKAKRFLKTAVASHSAFDWELNLSLADGNVPFFCSAALTNRGILVVGTKDVAASKPSQRAISHGTGSHPVMKPALQELTSLRQAKTRARRRLRSGLSQLNKALKEASDLSELSSKTHAAEQLNVVHMLAHDLRNPLSGILTATQYLVEDASPLLENEHVTLLRSIESSSEFMLKLIRDML